MSVRRENPFGASPVVIEYGGQTYTGFFRVNNGMLHVTSDYGEQWARAGNSPVELLAQTILHQLVENSRR